MRNQDEKKCEHDKGDYWSYPSLCYPRQMINCVKDESTPICPICKPSEPKQEPKSKCCNAQIIKTYDGARLHNQMCIRCKTDI